MTKFLKNSKQHLLKQCLINQKKCAWVYQPKSNSKSYKMASILTRWSKKEKWRRENLLKNNSVLIAKSSMSKYLWIVYWKTIFQWNQIPPITSMILSCLLVKVITKLFWKWKKICLKLRLEEDRLYYQLL